MSIAYTPTTNFGAKDSLPANDPAKVIKGAEFTTEYTAIQSAFALAAPASNPTFTGTATFSSIAVNQTYLMEDGSSIIDSHGNAIQPAPGAGQSGSIAGFDIDDARIGATTPLDGTFTSITGLSASVGAGGLSVTGSATLASASIAGDLTVDTSTLVADSTNNFVGIGTAAPDATLKVRGSTGAVIATGNIPRQTYTSIGNLQVATAGSGGILIHSESTTADGAITFGDGTFAGRITYEHDNDALTFTTATEERVRISSNGRVGIGVDDPSYTLSLDAKEQSSGTYIGLENAVTNFLSTEWGGLLVDSADASGAGAGVKGSIRATSPGGNGSSVGWEFNVGSSAGNDRTAMAITSGGRVGIGTDDPNTNQLLVKNKGGAYDSGLRVLSNDAAANWARVDLKNVNADDSFILYQDQAGNAGIRNDVTSPSSPGTMTFIAGNDVDGTFKFETSSGVEALRIDSSGNLLVGKTASSGSAAGVEVRPSGYLSVISSTASPFFIRLNGLSGTQSVMNFFRDGTASGGVNTTSGGTPVFYAASDERLKDNIVDHESELANVMALRPARWDWKDEARGSGEGFIAQELEQTAWADLVSEGEDGYKQVSGLGAVETRLIKALQEAVGRIESLEAEVEALKNA